MFFYNNTKIITSIHYSLDIPLYVKYLLINKSKANLLCMNTFYSQRHTWNRCLYKLKQ